MECDSRWRTMTSVDDNYDALKQEILNNSHHFSPEDIEELVKEYETVIASKRRSSYIKHIDDLVSVLEKRCHISAEDPTQLHKIVNRLPYHCRDSVLSRFNYQQATENDTPNNNFNAPCLATPQENCSSFRPSNRQKLPLYVVEHISEEIGNKWRDLARKLDLRQGDIKSIECKYPQDFQKCAYESLVLYQSKCQNDDLHLNLLKALAKARRQDLHDDIQDLLYRANT